MERAVEAFAARWSRPSVTRSWRSSIRQKRLSSQPVKCSSASLTCRRFRASSWQSASASISARLSRTRATTSATPSIRRRASPVWPRPGRPLTSGDTVARLPELLQCSTRDLDQMSVKGKAEELHVFEVLWQEGEELTMKAPSIRAGAKSAASAGAAPRLCVRYAGEVMVLDEKRRDFRWAGMRPAT